MKQSELNPLQRELARSPLAGPHPDADILTALAEGKLLQRERTEVFAHLASCQDCRKVLSMAAESAAIHETRVKPFLLPRSANQSSRAWLPWASIAAGILIVCSAGLLYKQKLELKPRATVATENTPAIPTEAAPKPQSSPPAESTVVPVQKTAGASTAKLKAPVLAKESTPQEPEIQDATGAAVQADQRLQDSQIEASSAVQVVPEVNIAKPAASAPAASGFVASQPSRAMAQGAIAGIARPHWRINSAGQAERSFGNEVWQAVLPNESSRMRVVSVFNRDVWIGGENTRLYHSADNGTTWNLVTLPEKDGRDHAIAHIRFQTSQAGAVEAVDGVTWTTADGGISWN
jgi:hypothetical protein